MLKRRLKLLGKILLALIALVLVFLLIERFRGQISLASYRRKLTAQGEKLSPQHFVSPISDEDNGAPTAVAAIEQLQKGNVLPKSPPPRMRLLSSGRAMVGFRESEWVDDKITNHWEQLAAVVRSLEGERVFFTVASQQLRASNDETYNFFFGVFSQMGDLFSGGESEQAGGVGKHPFS